MIFGPSRISRIKIFGIGLKRQKKRSIGTGVQLEVQPVEMS